MAQTNEELNEVIFGSENAMDLLQSAGVVDVVKVYEAVVGDLKLLTVFKIFKNLITCILINCMYI